MSSLYNIRYQRIGNKCRKLYVPRRRTREILKKLISDIRNHHDGILKSRKMQHTVHGFVKGGSFISNAWWHRGFQHTLSLDFKNWFGTVTEDLALKLLPSWVCDRHPKILFPDGAAQQGIPTSPFLANLSCFSLDRIIADLKLDLGFFVYTRYADDLCFSSDDLDLLMELKQRVPREVERYGFQVNAGKTRLQHARCGRRNVTGISVDDTLHITRKMKRKIRSSQYHQELATARGIQSAFNFEMKEMRELLLHTHRAADFTFVFCNNEDCFNDWRRLWQLDVNAAYQWEMT